MTDVLPGNEPESANELRAENRRLTDTLSRLERRLDALEATIDSARLPDGPPVVVDEAHDERAGVSRRGLLIGGAAGAVAAAAGLVFARPGVAAAGTSGGYTVTQNLNDFSEGTTPAGPMLWQYNQPVSNIFTNAPLTMTRTDPPNVDPMVVNSLINMYSDNTQVNSYPCPLYVELRATNNPNATGPSASSDSVGVQVRSYNRSTGTPWLTTFHSEPHHGQDVDGTLVGANGTSIGYNCEINRFTNLGHAFGVFVNNTPNSTTFGEDAMQIKSNKNGSNPNVTNGWLNGIHFVGPQTPSVPDGNIAINMNDATWSMGLDLGPNSMRLAAGQKIYLTSNNSAYIEYNPTSQRIEMYRNGTKVFSA